MTSVADVPHVEDARALVENISMLEDVRVLMDNFSMLEDVRVSVEDISLVEDTLALFALLETALRCSSPLLLASVAPKSS
ncbi:hypothetical protein GE21DRAFT_1055091 [Neurospora crassa]|nr:hypothetical protein GE21DRAFT_1055091 [Neurospora crassa]